MKPPRVADRGGSGRASPRGPATGISGGLTPHHQPPAFTSGSAGGRRAGRGGAGPPWARGSCCSCASRGTCATCAASPGAGPGRAAGHVALGRGSGPVGAQELPCRAGKVDGPGPRGCGLPGASWGPERAFLLERACEEKARWDSSRAVTSAPWERRSERSRRSGTVAGAAGSTEAVRGAVPSRRPRPDPGGVGEPSRRPPGGREDRTPRAAPASRPEASTGGPSIPGRVRPQGRGAALGRPGHPRGDASAGGRAGGNHAAAGGVWAGPATAGGQPVQGRRGGEHGRRPHGRPHLPRRGRDRRCATTGGMWLPRAGGRRPHRRASPGRPPMSRGRCPPGVSPVPRPI